VEQSLNEAASYAYAATSPTKDLDRGRPTSHVALKLVLTGTIRCSLQPEIHDPCTTRKGWNSPSRSPYASRISKRQSNAFSPAKCRCNECSSQEQKPWKVASHSSGEQCYPLSR
jgi:hypothetical protein